MAVRAARRGARAPGGGSATRQVASTAVVKVLSMGIGGIAGIVTSRLLIEHYGLDAYAQYGLLTALPSLMPFADLGVAAVLVNVVAESRDPRNDREVRRTITSAFRILLGSAAVIGAVSVLLAAAGLWPTVLGAGLLPDGGALAATICLLVFAVALPLGVGQRLMVSAGQVARQTAIAAVASPLVLAAVALSVWLRLDVGPYAAVFSFAANAIVALVCLVVAARLLSPQVRLALRDVPRVRSVPGARIVDVAWPMLVQMVALPVAMQTSRLLLSHMATSTDLAEYNFASQMFGLINQTVAAAGLALWPLYARARAGGRIVSPARAAAVFAAVALTLGGALWALMPVASDVVTQGKITVSALLAGSFVVFVGLQAAKYPFGMYMTDARGLRFQVLPVVAMVPVTLGLSALLIPRVGAAGPVVAVTVAVLLCQVLPNLWYVRRDLARRRAEAREPDEAPAASAPDVS